MMRVKGYDEIDQAIEYLRERAKHEMAEETTDWALVDAIDTVLSIIHELDT